MFCGCRQKIVVSTYWGIFLGSPVSSYDSEKCYGKVKIFSAIVVKQQILVFGGSFFQREPNWDWLLIRHWMGNVDGLMFSFAFGEKNLCLYYESKVKNGCFYGLLPHSQSLEGLNWNHHWFLSFFEGSSELKWRVSNWTVLSNQKLWVSYCREAYEKA